MANKDEDLIEIQVDSELLDQVKALIAPLGLSPEELVVRFMEYCANPARLSTSSVLIISTSLMLPPITRSTTSVPCRSAPDVGGSLGKTCGKAT